MDRKILVAYFSASGVTAKVAEKLAEAVVAANWTQADVLLVDYLQSWLKIVKPTIATSTHQSYKNMIDGRINRHFQALGVSLGDLTPTQIQDFYQIILDEGYTPNTVIHYHAVLRRVLQNAVKKDIIARNPAYRIDKSKKNQYPCHWLCVSHYQGTLRFFTD